MTLKKFRAKTHKSSKKRIKVTNGGDLKIGKLMINRANRQHRMIGKSRSRVLSGKKYKVLASCYNKLRAII
jgi:ribosomal protein L35